MLRLSLVLLLPLMLAVTGCGGSSISSGGSSNGLTISPGSLSMDTNCTGCNKAGSGYEQFSALNSSGAAVSVNWTVSGGDTYAKAGSINTSGQYTPPSYLTADSVKVTVTATSTANSSQTATATVTVTPGFLQPLAPENAALGANGTITVTGYIAEVGGTEGINFTTASTANGSSGGQGTVVMAPCVRGTLQNGAFTSCAATYKAPATISATAATYVVGTVGSTASKESTVVLLNTDGVNSNPASHQAQLPTPVDLGSSGGNNKDYDTTTQNNQSYISDCCGGTLGALVKDSSGNQYILSNNHVLARSDQAGASEAIIQPGLIDNTSGACQPVGQGGNESQVGVLKGFVPIKSASTNVDAAIASVNSGAVNSSGAILELGTKQADGTLAAAPPGTSCTISASVAGANCTPGKGETALPNMIVAKSGRTTGLTCASIYAVNLQVSVDYFTNCGETNPYYTKIYTNQIAVEGEHFSDAGDSGSLLVDTKNGEPVGLFYAGGLSTDGTSEGVASPVGEVLSELNSFVGNNTANYTFVGGADHAVSCLNYGSSTASAAQARTLSGAEMDRAQQAMIDARALVNPSAGILGIATGKSSDRPGEAAVIVYVNPNQSVSVPPTIDGVRTAVIPSTPQAVSMGTAPQSLLQAGPVRALSAAVLHQAAGVQRQLAVSLMKQNPAFFGVGVGQSLDNPQEAALVIFVDKNHVPAHLPQTINGLRTRYVIMERLHVTRSYLSAIPRRSRCMARPAANSSGFDWIDAKRLRGLNLY